MPWKPEIPPVEVVEASFPRDVFDGASAALDRIFWLDLPEEQHDTLLQRAGETENQLEELVTIWDRIGDDRINAIEARREHYDLADELGLSNYTLGDGTYPQLEETWRREAAAEIALRLDYKSLFVFADLLVASYVVMSEGIWEAPAGVVHQRGATAFIGSVEKLRAAAAPLPKPFVSYMDVLLEPLRAVDNMLGFYRDKFIVHLPTDMLTSGGGGSLSVPLDFHVDHAQRREVADAELRRLRRTLRQVEKAEGLNLGNDEPDPRPKLRKLGLMIGKLKLKSSVVCVQNLLKDWGATSPPAFTVARSLNDLFETWGGVCVEKVGLMDPTA